VTNADLLLASASSLRALIQRPEQQSSIMIFFDIDGTLIDHASASAAASLSLFDYFAGEIPFVREEFPNVWETH